MQIQMNYSHIDHSDALDAKVRAELDSTIGRFADRLTRIEVHITDRNSDAKHGPSDKRCLLEARPRGLDPLVAEATADDYYKAVADAATKLKHVLTSKLDR